MIPVSDRKLQLLNRLGVLKDRLSSIEGELDSQHSSDWEDLATEREGDQVLEGMGLSGAQEIRMIEAALQRIDDGTYGECVICGARIREERLDLLPYTPFCKDCARQH